MSYTDTTFNAGFRLIDFASDPYHEDEWFNWRLVDGMLQLNQTTTPFCVATGTGAAYVADYAADQTLVVGLTISFKTPAANTGAVTLAVDGQAAKPIKINGTDPAGGTLVIGSLVKVVYDGTNFNVVYPAFSGSVPSKITTAISGATADALADDFVVENSTDVGASLLSPNGTKGRWVMGSVAKPMAGGVVYDHATDRLYLRSNQVDGPYSDATQIVRQPAKPYVYAYSQYTASAALNGGAGVLIVAVESVDATNSYVLGTGIFTAPVAGVYELVAEAILQSSNNVSNIWEFRKNGASLAPYGEFNAPSTGYCGTTLTAIATLAAGDTITLYKGSGGGMLNVNGHLSVNIKLVI